MHLLTQNVLNYSELLRLSKKVGGEAQNLGGDFGGESVLSLGETLGERP